MPKKPPSQTNSLVQSEKEEDLEGDQLALDDFCKGIEYEDISFDAWSATHHDLNLCIPIFISPQKARLGGDYDLKFVRTIIRTDELGSILGRDKSHVQLTLKLPANQSKNYEIVLENEGDCLGNNFGQLRVQVRIKQGTSLSQD